MDPLTRRQAMFGSTSWTPQISTCELSDGFIESPCKRCRHMKERLDKNLCTQYLDCPIRVDKPIIQSMKPSTEPEKKIVFYKCKFPGCEETFKRSTQKYCRRHALVIRSRRERYKKRYGEKAPISFLHAPIDNSKIRLPGEKHPCHFPDCNEQASRRTDYCRSHNILIRDRRIRWVKKYGVEPDKEWLFCPVGDASMSCKPTT